MHLALLALGEQVDAAQTARRLLDATLAEDERHHRQLVLLAQHLNH